MDPSGPGTAKDDSSDKSEPSTSGLTATVEAGRQSSTPMPDKCFQCEYRDGDRCGVEGYFPHPFNPQELEAIKWCPYDGTPLYKLVRQAGLEGCTLLESSC